MWMVMNVPPMRLSSVIEIPDADANRWRNVYRTKAEALAVAARSNRIVALRASKLAEQQECKLEAETGQRLTVEEMIEFAKQSKPVDPASKRRFERTEKSAERSKVNRDRLEARKKAIDEEYRAALQARN